VRESLEVAPGAFTTDIVEPAVGDPALVGIVADVVEDLDGRVLDECT